MPSPARIARNPSDRQTHASVTRDISRLPARALSRLLRLWVASATFVAVLSVTVAGVDVQIDYDKAFDFKTLRTWGWNPEGPGEVKMARTQDDDPEAMRVHAEPVIVDAVMLAMTDRKLRAATSEPDLVVTYYLLLTTNMSTQEMGQFLPAVPMWGLPPFSASTTSMKVMNKGSLVLDLKSRQNIVWRGVAQAKIDIGSEPKKREALLRDAVRDLLRKFPPR